MKRFFPTAFLRVLCFFVELKRKLLPRLKSILPHKSINNHPLLRRFSNKIKSYNLLPLYHSVKEVILRKRDSFAFVYFILISDTTKGENSLTELAGNGLTEVDRINRQAYNFIHRFLQLFLFQISNEHT